ncbi:hypothetical protein DHW03_05640 [Pedobacter yonginense]|uniref:Lipoprotein n=1 Tax=Pedobacter yonginense TaxID=651869 RepID=A0A317ETZ7_9SPHI|nr:hypothetical protein [Pedobacter yonginense]PWS29299.1 hypothetical protein DHW03_05640 [Pedobacter yonginense]
MKYIFLFLTASILASCNISAGTHGSFKQYDFKVSKTILEKAVNALIENNPNIMRDSLKTLDNYNDGTTYFTIKIASSGINNEYVVRYYGDEKDWNSERSSAIFICYAYHNNYGGTSETDKLTNAEKKDLLIYFEANFIEKLHKELALSQK